MYPVGSIYISVNNETPFQNIPGVTSVWDRVPSDLSLWSANDHLGEQVTWLLPQHSHTYTAPKTIISEDMHTTSSSSSSISEQIGATTYWPTNNDEHKGTLVRPPSILVSIWKRLS